jgi:acyl-CoA oxidase
MKNLEAQMSPAQRAYWIPKTETFEICGSYAQTELGHGSNVQAIETTATYDHDTDEFILNSPTVSSSKYWIGALGVWATHALVVARMIIKDQDLGNHLFMVQVRDLETHDLAPDVIIHEQGEKSMGTFASMDNGAMQLRNKRIPRSQMLAGLVSVDRNGNYTKAKHTNKKHSYTSMIIIRGLMSEEIGQDVCKAIVIALKYTKFRRQFNSKAGEETRVIKYASVQHRLFPALSRVSRDIPNDTSTKPLFRQ